jgi:excisionase family DNA binding protein
LTVAEVAAMLKVSPHTIRAWVKKGKIPVHKVGRQVRFHRPEVMDWVLSGRAAGDVRK